MVRTYLRKDPTKRFDIKDSIASIKQYITKNKRRTAMYGGIGFVVLVVLLQLVIYSGRLPMFTQIANSNVGNITTKQANERVGEIYKNTKIKLLAQDSDEDLAEIAPSEMGVDLQTSEYVNSLMMPLWLRFIPSSPLWAHTIIKPQSSYVVDETKLTQYIDKTFTKECKIVPQNATLLVENDTIVVKSSRIGGECKYDQLIASLKETKPSLGEQNNISLPVTPIQPKIEDSKAEELKNTLNKNIGDGITVKAGDKSFNASASDVRAWLRFTAPDEGIVVSVDPAASEAFFKDTVAPSVTKPAGVSKITTKDFVEVSRVNGAAGTGLNYDSTRQTVVEYLLGKKNEVVAVVQKIEPKLEYIRSYSNTDEGLSALIKQFTEDKKGSFGVAMIELDGKRRTAAFNGDKQFTSASTYKMLVAFSVLKRVESGQMSWSESIAGGRNLEKCFDDMIVLSDNPCPLALVSKIGPSSLQKDVKELGLNNTNFLNKDSFKMTASDLAKFAAMLEARQLPISRASQDKLINAMKRNIYRQGIPAGSSGTVADKVGFIDVYLHDVGIVYGTNGGTYVLAILTEGSSWADIAELTKKIETLRNQ